MGFAIKQIFSIVGDYVARVKSLFSLNKKRTERSMDQRVLDAINQGFQENERATVIDCLSSIGLEEVSSPANLQQTRMAILALSNGDVSQVALLTKKAKTDFRDIVMWAEKGTEKMKADLGRDFLSLITLAEKGFITLADLDPKKTIESIKANVNSIQDSEKLIKRIEQFVQSKQ